MKAAARNITILLAAVTVGSAIGVDQVQAQIVPNPGDTGTTVSPVGNRFDIGGGRLSGDNANLFHSLSQFGLTQSQIANFLSNPTTRNILVRVTGGDASRLDGLIQVSGSNANLFLMNPAGIVFGTSATLNVSGAFTATTANGIGFGTSWFNASGTNNYEALVGNPSSYAFTVTQPGSIINAGNLTVGVGQQLALLAGTVVSSGGLSAPNGQVIVAAVPGQSIVRLTQPGSLLNLEIQRPTPNDRVEAWTLPVLSLPQLLTGGSGTNATGLTVDASGQVTLTGSGVPITPGDVAVRQVNAAPGGTSFRAIGSVLGATAFPQILPDRSGDAIRPNIAPPTSVQTLPPNAVLPVAPPVVPLPSFPPNQVLPPTNLVVPPTRFLPLPSIRQAVPPDSTLPIDPSPSVTAPTSPVRVVSPPTRFLPLPSIRQAVPPDSTLPIVPSPGVTAPDCGAACPASTTLTAPPPSTLPQPITAPPSTLPPQIGKTDTGAPIVTFQPLSNQANPAVTLSEPLPQYPSQPTASQPTPVQTTATQTTATQTTSVQTNAVEVNFVQRGDAILPTSDPAQNLSTDAIDDINQASAIAHQLESLKKYLQQRWKATPQLATKLQYTLLLDARGAIQQIVPIGQEAAAYLADLELAPVSQPVVRQTAHGLEVIVRLSPDGTVEVLPNSLTLRPR